MTITQAKKLSEAHGYYFYYDRSLRLWAHYPAAEDFGAEDGDTHYHTRATLAVTTPKQFVGWMQ